MKTQNKILFAFILNLFFSIFEFFGGIFTGSVAIMSDAVHDLGDALSIGFSYFLERKSKKQPDELYTYGYLRFSVMGSLLTTFVLLCGSVIVIIHAISKILNPIKINYDGMIIFAIIGVIINFTAAYFTHGGHSLNQKAVNLHMLEDMLGWVIVLIGSIVMKFTNLSIIDPLLSITVAVFVLVNALKNLKEIVNLFLEKTPKNINIEEIKEHILNIDDITDVHHIHIRSIDGENNYATMHIVTDGDQQIVKDKVRAELKEHGICHATLELENTDEHCREYNCSTKHSHNHHHRHHHH